MTRKEKIASGVIALNHLIGWVGLNFTEYPSIFVLLTPVNILVTVAVIASFVQPFNKKFGWFMLLSSVFGWLVEFVGVHSGRLFGSYEYVNLAGPALFEIPLIIGVNWFLLSYAIANLLDIIKINNIYLFTFLGAAAMVLLDVFIEPFAVEFKLWEWATLTGMPALQNYIAWFFVSIFIFVLYKKMKFKQTNRVAALSLGVMLLFFILNFIVICLFS